VLDLGFNGLDDAGVRAVVESGSLARLHTLRVAGNPIGDAGVAALAGSPLLRRMLARDARLDLRSNAIGPTGAELLAKCPAVAAADELDLTGNYLRDAGVAALVRGPHLARLRALELGQNEVTDLGAAAVADGLGRFPRLARLDMGGNRLTRRGIDLLLAAAEARGVAVEAGGNVHYPPPSVPPVAVGEVVDGVLDGVADLKRRVAHPARRTDP
jgi:Ran GTPase-activating protein (RanGAP) involved in mRNA processing and transport